MYPCISNQEQHIFNRLYKLIQFMILDLVLKIRSYFCNSIYNQLRVHLSDVLNSKRSRSMKPISRGLLSHLSLQFKSPECDASARPLA